MLDSKTLGCFLLFAALFASGCSSSTVWLSVTPSENSNGGRPLYMVVCSVDKSAYLTESYQQVAARVFKNPPDPSVLASEVLFPSTEKGFSVEKPSDKGLAVYFLFTRPGDRWKTLFEEPFPDDVSFTLTDFEIGKQE